MRFKSLPAVVLVAFAASSMSVAAKPPDADACVQDCGYEDEPVLDAAALVPPALLSGPNYRVDPKVPVGGYMARFRITTAYGPLNADSMQLLPIRIGEIPAIETLNLASRSGAFAHALAMRGKKTGNAIVNVFAHPIDSIVGLPGGVARYFKTQIDLWSGRAQSASDRSSRIFENKGDPFRAPDGPMTAGRDLGHVHVEPPIMSTDSTVNPEPTYANEAKGTIIGNRVDASTAGANATGKDMPDTIEPDAARQDNAAAATGPDPPEQKKSHAWYARAASEVGREARRYLKYGRARNEIAKYLSVDPNTSNPYIVERLDSLAWAATWGNFSAGEALAQIAGPAAEVITNSGLVNQYVLTHTPEQIRARNEKNLQTLCSDEFGIRQFLRHGGFNDTLRTNLVDSLLKLKPASGCNEFLDLGATTRGEVEARYLVDALALILRHMPNPVGGKLLVAGAAVVYITPDGKLWLPMPVDYLSWNIDIDQFFERPEFRQAHKTVLIGGEATALAQRKLREIGWKVVLRAPYDGAPSYAKSESG